MHERPEDWRRESVEIGGGRKGIEYGPCLDIVPEALHEARGSGMREWNAGEAFPIHRMILKQHITDNSAGRAGHTPVIV